MKFGKKVFSWFYLGGDEIVLERGRKQFYFFILFFMYLTQGESQFACLLLAVIAYSLRPKLFRLVRKTQLFRVTSLIALSLLKKSQKFPKLPLNKFIKKLFKKKKHFQYWRQLPRNFQSYCRFQFLLMYYSYNLQTYIQIEILQPPSLIQIQSLSLNKILTRQIRNSTCGKTIALMDFKIQVLN